MQDPYIIIPDRVLEDDSLSPRAVILYGILLRMQQQKGYCFATNSYLSKKLKLNKRRTSALINQLLSLGYIQASSEQEGEYQGRRLFITPLQKIAIPLAKNCHPHSKKVRGSIAENCQPPLAKNCHQNNTSMNNISKYEKENIKEKPTASKKLTPPTIDELQNYINEKSYHINAEEFLAFYEANGWVQGKSRKPIKSWKACCTTWEVAYKKRAAGRRHKEDELREKSFGLGEVGKIDF